MSRCMGGVIFREPEAGEYEVLLLQRASHDHYPLEWEVPRGHCNRGETPFMCLFREVKEETNLEVIPISFLGTVRYPKDGEDAVIRYYLCLSEEGEVDLDPQEHKAFKWVRTFAEAQLHISPETAPIVKEAFKLFEEPL